MSPLSIREEKGVEETRLSWFAGAISPERRVAAGRGGRRPFLPFGFPPQVPFGSSTAVLLLQPLERGDFACLATACTQHDVCEKKSVRSGKRNGRKNLYAHFLSERV